jgi:hypothetical protein
MMRITITTVAVADIPVMLGHLRFRLGQAVGQ